MKSRNEGHLSAGLIVLVMLGSIGTSVLSAAENPTETRAVGGEWHYGPTTPFAFMRFDAGYNPLDRQLYVLGGRLADGSTDGSIWVGDPVSGIWTDTGVDLPEPISNYHVNLYEDELFGILLTFCGRPDAGGVTNAVQFFNTSLGNSGIIAGDEYPGSLSCASGLNAVWRNKVVVAGGFDSVTPPYHPSETWIFDPDLAFGGGPWTQLPTATLTPARAYIMSAVVDDRVYAIGGAYFDTPNLINVDTVQVLDPAASTPVWTSLAPLPEPCSSGRAWGFDSHSSLSAFGTPLAGKIITTCGVWPDENNHVYVYDTHRDSWQEFPFLITDRRDLAAEFLPTDGGQPLTGMPGIWVWGGRQDSDATVLDTSEYYELEPSMCSALLVNDDPFPAPDGGGGLPYYMSALDTLGVAYELWDTNASGSPPAAVLHPYNVVTWFTGYDWQNVVDPTEQSSLTQYLDGGGTLLLSAEDQLFAHGMTPFLSDYMWVGSANEDVQLDIVEGTGPIYGDIPECPMNAPELWGEYWPGDLEDDEVAARPGGFEPLSYTASGNPNATRYDGGHFRTMFMGFPVEWVRTAKARGDILGPMVRWSICPLFADDFESNGTLRWTVTVE